MDKQIPVMIRRRKLAIRWLKVAAAVVAVTVAVVWFAGFSRSSVKRSTLRLGTADTGTIESTFSATGQVQPAYEEIVTTPISSRVLEICHAEGDTVELGEPLLVLDLQQVSNDYQSLLDQRQIREEALRQLRINCENSLRDLEMKIQVKEMSVDQLQRNLRNEIYLDSLGSGTGESVRKAEYDWRIADMELRTMRQDLITQRDFKQADVRMKELELNTFLRTIQDMETKFAGARILSPRRAVLTQITPSVGQLVGSGSQVAVVADLDHFKVTSEISDIYSDRLANGMKVDLRLGTEVIPATLVDLSPVSRSGVLTFVALPDNDGHPALRPGQRAEVYLKDKVIPGAVRIPNGPYYTSGAGIYDMYVVNADSTLVERRSVRLGQANYDYVEVLSGIEPGERVVLSDMGAYKTYTSLKLK